MEWEDTKENYVPVKHGRSAAALSTPLSVVKRRSELEEAKRSFLDNIQGAEDPLPAWMKYIKWTQEQYATQGSKAELQQVLEAATKSLSSSDRYNNDVRLLRIWVQYADCLPDPSDVFLHLAERGIGRDHALLYEAYATYLELKGNFSQAELVYQDGINRLAKPLERLKQKQAAFQQRMAKRIQRQTSEAALGMDTAADASSMARATLAPVLAPVDTTLLDENGRPIRASRQQQQHRLPPQASSVAAGVRAATHSSSNSRQPAGLWGNLGGTAAHVGGMFGLGISSSGSSAAVPPKQPVNGAKLFEIQVDEEFGPSGSGPAATAFPAAISAGQQQSDRQLPAYAVSRKENTTKPGEWAGTKLKQQQMFTAPVATRLEVCEDDDLAEPEAPTPQQQQQLNSARHALDATPAGQTGAPAGAAVGAGGTHSSRGMFGLTGAGQPAVQHQQQDQNQQVRQQHHQRSTGPPSKVSSSISSSSSKAAPTAAASASTGPHGYNESLLTGPDGCELSFEEIRAAAYRARKLEQQQQQQQKHQQKQPQQEREPQRRQQQQQENPQQQREQQQHRERQSQLAQQQHKQHEQQRCLQKQQQLQEQVLQQQAQKMQPKAVLSVCADESDDDSSPAATRGADQRWQHRQATGAASSQHNSQPQQLQAQQQWQQHPGIASEPTVTLNTRAALDSLNMMFSSDLPTMTLPKNAIAAAAGAGSYSGASASTAGNKAAGRKSMGLGGGFTTAEPTVTINTRAAFEAMNGMFGADDTTTMHGFSQGPRGSAAARYGGYGGVHPVRAGGGAEPTVTINTRAAFDYMNDVFGDMTGQQTMTGRQMSMQHSRAERRGGTSRLSMAAGLSLYEDTEFVGARLGGRGGVAGSGSGLGLCEDTEFITRPVGGAAGHGAVNTGLGLCEDTEFITRPVGGVAGTGRNGSSNALGLCEDTEFITRPVGGAAASRSGLGGAGGSSNGLGLCEDTEFITRSVGAATAGMGGLSLYEDTEFVGAKLSSGNAAAGGGLGLAEDTEFMTRGVGESATAVAAAGRPAPAGFMRRSASSKPRLPDECSDSTTGLLRVKENVPAAAATTAARGGQRSAFGQTGAAAVAATTAGAGSSRATTGSAPSSPVAAHYHQQQQHSGPAWGAVTPGKPPMGPSSAASTPARHHPGTPGTPWAQPMEDFEVMESPAVRAALAERPALARSPVASMPSPGLGARENNPVEPESMQHPVPRRSLHDRGARAAALQPLSDSRAEQLGVHIEPAPVPGYDGAHHGDSAVDGSSRLGRRQGRALRSLDFRPESCS